MKQPSILTVKKILPTVVAIWLMTLALSVPAFATPFTWTQTRTFNSIVLGNNDNYTFSFDLKSSPVDPQIYLPGSDTITSALLSINFDNIGGNKVPKTSILIDNVTWLTNFVIADINSAILGTGLTQLNADGTLSVGIKMNTGLGTAHATLVDSTLEATGTIPTVIEQVPPIPEPSTLILLGAGFLGLAIYGKRRRRE
jgi:hypothetical protein